MYIIGEIVQVRVRGKWYDAEVLDVTGSGLFVYIYDFRVKKNVTLSSVRRG